MDSRLAHLWPRPYKTSLGKASIMALLAKGLCIVYRLVEPLQDTFLCIFMWKFWSMLPQAHLSKDDTLIIFLFSRGTNTMQKLFAKWSNFGWKSFPKNNFDVFQLHILKFSLFISFYKTNISKKFKVALNVTFGIIFGLFAAKRLVYWWRALLGPCVNEPFKTRWILHQYSSNPTQLR